MTLKNWQKNIAIISFNYDRCIEQYLIEAISQTFGIPYNEAHSLVSNIEIIHPYGSLGALPNTQGMEGDNVRFGFNIDSGLNPWPIAERIKTYTEQINDTTLIRRIHNAVKYANQIMFLGFAFHPQNMELLKIPSKATGKFVYATGLGVSPQESEEVISRILSLFLKPESIDNSFYRNLIHLENNTTCRKLFEIHGRNVSGA